MPTHSLQQGANALTKIATFLTVLATVLVSLLPAAPAQAQRDRVFVASYGSDSNPCTFGSPCKTFQNAINVAAQGGEVTAIDSAGFGTFTIEHSITITSPNGVEAGIATPANGTAITINAGPQDVIHLSGLTLDGAGASGTGGIVFNSGGTLRIQNSVIRNFANQGIQFQPTGSSQLFVSNTLISDNGNVGFALEPFGSSLPVAAVLDHVAIENNRNHGLYVYTVNPAINVTVNDSVVANNGGDGIRSFSLQGPISTMVRNTIIANNSGNGLTAAGSNGAATWVARSTITGNGTGWLAPGGQGTVTSFGDNSIFGNAAGNTAPPSIGYE